MAQPNQGGTHDQAAWLDVYLLLLIIVVFFFMIRPQQKTEKFNNTEMLLKRR